MEAIRELLIGVIPMCDIEGTFIVSEPDALVEQKNALRLKKFLKDSILFNNDLNRAFVYSQQYRLETIEEKLYMSYKKPYSRQVVKLSQLLVRCLHIKRWYVHDDPRRDEITRWIEQIEKDISYLMRIGIDNAADWDSYIEDLKQKFKSYKRQ